MDMLFLVCTVFGITLLTCQVLLSVLGLDRRDQFPDRDTEWLSLGDQKSTNSAADSGSGANVTVSNVVPENPVRVGIRAVGMAITFFGLAGSAAEASQFKQPMTLAIALTGSVVALIVVYLLPKGSFDPFAGNADDDSSTDLQDDPEQASDQSVAINRAKSF